MRKATLPAAAPRRLPPTASLHENSARAVSVPPTVWGRIAEVFNVEAMSVVTQQLKKVLAIVIRITIGILLILLGILGGFLPIVPGFIFFLFGIIVLSYDVPFIRRLVERLVRRYPHQAEKLHQMSEWFHRKFHLPRFHLPGLERRRKGRRSNVAVREASPTEPDHD
jgi:hypothetical protein